MFNYYVYVLALHAFWFALCLRNFKILHAAFAASVLLSIASMSFAPQTTSFIFGVAGLWSSTLLIVVAGLAFGFCLPESWPERKGWRRYFGVPLDDANQPIASQACFWILMLLNLATIVAVLVTADSIVRLGNDTLGWDGLNYHLTAATSLFQDGSIRNDIQPFTYWVPKNIEVLSTWTVWLSGSEHAVSWPTIEFMLLGMCCVFGLGRVFKLPTMLCWSLSAMAGTSTGLFVQFSSGYIDAFCAPLLIAACFFVFRLWEKKTISMADALLAAIAIAYPLQVRASMLLASGLMTLILCMIIWRAPVSTARRAQLVVASFCYIFLAGGLWYILHWIEFGSPSYPMPFPAAKFLRSLGLRINDGRPNSDLLEVMGAALRMTSGEVARLPLSNKALRALQTFIGDIAQYQQDYSSGAGGGSLAQSLLALGSAIGVAILAPLRKRWLHLLLLLMGLVIFLGTPYPHAGRYALATNWAIFMLNMVLLFALIFSSASSQHSRAKRVDIFCCALTIAVIAALDYPRWFELLKKNNHFASQSAAVTLGYDTVNSDNLLPQRYRYLRANPSSNICVALYSVSDNPLWYYYWGPKWQNTVRPWTPSTAAQCDFLVGKQPEVWAMQESVKSQFQAIFKDNESYYLYKRRVYPSGG